jgi:hypothetical protein
MSNKPLKTSYKIATENFIPVQDRSNALELLGTENLPRESPRDEFYTFLQVFGKKNSFWYIASLTCENEENVAEIGIGHLSVRKGKILLVRESVYTTIINNVAHAGDAKFLPFRDVERGQTLTVSSYNPPNVESTFQEPNSLLKSNSDGPASPVKIENNSVLVCYKNKLVSVTFKELAGLLKRYL